MAAGVASGASALAPRWGQGSTSWAESAATPVPAPPVPEAAALASQPAPATEDPEAAADAEDDWEAEKEKCSFCKAFLKSPCKLPFKSWSICVDKAKEEEQDFVTVCSAFTSALLECTSTHNEFFAELNKNDDVQEDPEGEGEGEGEGEVVGDKEGQEGEAEEKGKEEVGAAVPATTEAAAEKRP